jgi:hypothetical protein
VAQRWLTDLLAGIASSRDMGLPADRATGGAPAPAENAPQRPGMVGEGQDPSLALVEAYQMWKRRSGRGEPFARAGNVQRGLGSLSGPVEGSAEPVGGRPHPMLTGGPAVNRSGNERAGQAFQRYDLGDSVAHVYYTGGKRRVVVVPKKR